MVRPKGGKNVNHSKKEKLALVLRNLSGETLTNNGASVKSRKPITEPYPCIFAERDSRLLLFPTGKIPERIQPPKA